jgi:hypothetical protein
MTSTQRGAALLVVLLSLAMLFSLGVPFLFMGQMRSEAARDTFDRSRARVAVSSAAEHAQWMLGDTHPALDATPWWDATAEWNQPSSEPLPQALGGAWANSTESWGVETDSTQGLISLATAPPLLLQNLLHPCFLSEDASFEDSSLLVTSTEGFPEAGFVLMGGLWVEYQSKTATTFDEISQAPNPPEDLESTRFREGQAIIDQRIVNLAMARMRFGEVRAPEFLDDLFSFNFGDPNTPLLPEEDRRALADVSWLSTGAFGESAWQPSTWMSASPSEENPNIVRAADRSVFSPGTVVRIESPTFGLSIDSLVLDGGGSALILPQDMPPDLPAWDTRITPARRDPVDINACRRDVLEALMLGLRFRGRPVVNNQTERSGFTRRHYVSASTARLIADAIIQARPVQGPDDLWQRVLRRLVAEGSISDADAWVVHLNGLDPNSGNLAASTVGFAYRSGDRFLQRVNAAHRSPVGATLSRAGVEQDVQVAPSGPLLQVWETQRDFEEAGRYARGLHKVVTLPNSRGRLGGHTDGQNRCRPRITCAVSAGGSSTSRPSLRPWAGTWPNKARARASWRSGGSARTILAAAITRRCRSRAGSACRSSAPRTACSSRSRATTRIVRSWWWPSKKVRCSSAPTTTPATTRPTRRTLSRPGRSRSTRRNTSWKIAGSTLARCCVRCGPAGCRRSSTACRAASSTASRTPPTSSRPTRRATPTARSQSRARKASRHAA